MLISAIHQHEASVTIHLAFCVQQLPIKFSRSVMSNSLQVHGLHCPWNSPGQNTGVGSQPFPSPGDLPNPWIKPRSPTLQADSLPAEPQGKPKNTGVGSLFLLQGIFLTQELNRGLLHGRWILYHLSYEGSPWYTLPKIKEG